MGNARTSFLSAYVTIPFSPDEAEILGPFPFRRDLLDLLVPKHPTRNFMRAIVSTIDHTFYFCATAWHR